MGDAEPDGLFGAELMGIMIPVALWGLLRGLPGVTHGALQTLPAAKQGHVVLPGCYHDHLIAAWQSVQPQASTSDSVGQFSAQDKGSPGLACRSQQGMASQASALFLLASSQAPGSAPLLQAADLGERGTFPAWHGPSLQPEGSECDGWAWDPPWTEIM